MDFFRASALVILLSSTILPILAFPKPQGPPQGQPPPGWPPQGQPPPGQPPQGQPGWPPQGQPPQGQPPPGQPPPGQPPHGQPPQGQQQPGQPPQGQQGQPPQGQQQPGQPPQGQRGQPPQGQQQPGQPPQDQPPHGQPPHGQQPPPGWPPHGQPGQQMPPPGWPHQGPPDQPQEGQNQMPDANAAAEVLPVGSGSLGEEYGNALPPLTPEENDIVDKEVVELAENIAESVMEFIEEDEALAIEEELGEPEPVSMLEESHMPGRRSRAWTMTAPFLLIIVVQTSHAIL